MAETLSSPETTEPVETRKRQIAYWLPAETLDRIDQLAKAAGLPRTKYMTRAALGELDIDPADERFHTIEARLLRLERQLGL